MKERKIPKPKGEKVKPGKIENKMVKRAEKSKAHKPSKKV